MQPLVSIITVNYRNDADTASMLASIAQAGYDNLEVIVVNNAATLDNTAFFQAILPQAKVVNVPENLGFAGGNNVGLCMAKGQYLYLVNNDTELLGNSIAPLVARLESNAQIGAVSPKICYYQAPHLVQYAGFTKLHPITGRNIAHGKGAPDSGGVAQPTSYTHGAAMMVSRKALDAVGLMDESYFLYYEELDWCERMARAGFISFYEPAAKILHKESASTGKISPLKVFYHIKNRFRFMQKFQPRHFFVAFAAYFYAVAIPRAIWKYRHSPELTQSIFNAVRSLRY